MVGAGGPARARCTAEQAAGTPAAESASAASVPPASSSAAAATRAGRSGCAARSPARSCADWPASTDSIWPGSAAPARKAGSCARDVERRTRAERAAYPCAGRGGSSRVRAAEDAGGSARPRGSAEATAYVDAEPSRMRRAIARRLAESKATVPHFYLEADCRVDRLMTLRREINASQPIKVSVNDFVLKAVAAAFVDVPEANAIWLGDAIRRFSTVDVAVAVAIDEGLVTPVVRDVARRTLTDVSRTVSDLAERGRSNRLKQPELEGGVFAVSNLGMYGTERFAAIINPPHAGILAVGAATPRPVVDDGVIGVATVMSVTLSGDHRVFDGALGCRRGGAALQPVQPALRRQLDFGARR